ncbi:glucosamine 6-phosphate n-acetyltransferase [Quercus suber]|uniref:Glucosamine 6-phosphate N-acetyltransferase n=1 Tax=Quercus suber TaxID=58331 RepID=A0AAW0M7I5_QUESU
MHASNSSSEEEKFQVRKLQISDKNKGFIELLRQLTVCDSKIIAFLTEHAHLMGCYKVILDCSLENKAFYEKCGFKQKEIQMVKYFI